MLRTTSTKTEQAFIMSMWMSAHSGNICSFALTLLYIRWLGEGSHPIRVCVCARTRLHACLRMLVVCSSSKERLLCAEGFGFVITVLQRDISRYDMASSSHCLGGLSTRFCSHRLVVCAGFGALSFKERKVFVRFYSFCWRAWTNCA